jgi:hypothetical protein
MAGDLTEVLVRCERQYVGTWIADAIPAVATSQQNT